MSPVQLVGRAVSDGSRVFASTDSGRVVAVDAATGAVRWATEANPGDPPVSFPAVTAGVVAVNVPTEGAVRGLDAETGAVRWQTSVGGRARGWAPRAQDGVVYVSSSEPYALTALDAGTGTVLWSSPIQGATSAVPVVAGGTVYLATDDLYAVDAATGAVRWRVPASDSAADVRTTGGSPAVDTDGVYVAGRDGTVRAFDPVTGGLRWATPVGGLVLSDTAVTDGVVVAVNDAGQLHGLDAATGQSRWVQQVDPGGASPSAAPGAVVIGGRGQLRVFAPADGALRGTLPENAECDVDQPALLAGATVYFAGCRLQAATLP